MFFGFYLYVKYTDVLSWIFVILSELYVRQTFVAVFLSYVMFLLLLHFLNLDLKYTCAPVRTFMAVFLI